MLEYKNKGDELNIMKKYIFIFMVIALSIPAGLGAPNIYNTEIAHTDTALNGKFFTNGEKGISVSQYEGRVYMDSNIHYTGIVIKIKANAVAAITKKVIGTNLVNVVHRDNEGKIDSMRTVDLTPDNQGFAYLTTDFSEICIGCSVSTYSQSWGANTNYINLTLATSINGSGLTSVISIVDQKLNQSGIYASINRTGLVGWWKLDNNYVDSSGNGNNGTVYGSPSPAFVNIKYNNGSNFDGSDDFTMYASVNSGYNYTVSAWVQIPISHGTDRRMMLSNGGSEPFFSPDYTTTAKPMLRLGANNWLAGSTDLGDGRVHNIVFVANGPNAADISKAKIYIDGVEETYSSNSSAGAPALFSGTLMSGSYGFKGVIDDLKIFTRALSASEIQQDYLVGVRELQVKYGNNATWSSQINGSGSANLPSNELNTLIQYFVPDNFTSIDGVNCWNCSQQMKFARTLTVTGVQDTINISETHANGYQSINYSFTPNAVYNYSLLTINMTNISDITKGAPVLQNTTGRTLSGIYPNYQINFTMPIKDSEAWFNISIPYNNYPIFTSLPNSEYGTDQNITNLCSIYDYESNPLGGYIQLYQNYFEDSPILIGNSSYNTTFLCQDINFGTLPYGKYSVAPFVAETSNTILPLLSGHPHYNFDVVCYNYSLSGSVTNELGVPLMNARVYVGQTSNLTNATGYYFLSPVSSANETALARAIGYENNSQLIDITGDTSLNFTLQEFRQSTVSAPGFEGIAMIFIFAMIYIVLRNPNVK